MTEYQTEADTELQDAEFCSVAIYLVDRAFGGHEEGGWWYEYGIPQDAPEFALYLRGFNTWDEAADYAEDVNTNDPYLMTLNASRPPISSVVSEGVYVAVVTEGYPRPFPETIPHYE